MGRIKGKYVVRVTVDYDFEREPGMRPIDEMKKILFSGELTEALRRSIEDESDFGTVQATQLYANIYELNGENND